jgi:hypothetical protein
VPDPADAYPAVNPNRDLGFGSVVFADSRRRLLNRDGSFNVRRSGLGWRAALSLYHTASSVIRCTAYRTVEA